MADVPGTGAARLWRELGKPEPLEKPGPTHIIDARNLTKRYGEKTAVDGLRSSARSR